MIKKYKKIIAGLGGTVFIVGLLTLFNSNPSLIQGNISNLFSEKAPIITVIAPKDGIKVKSTSSNEYTIDLKIKTNSKSICYVINPHAERKNELWYALSLILSSDQNGLIHSYKNYDIGDLYNGSTSKTLKFICVEEKYYDQLDLGVHTNFNNSSDEYTSVSMTTVTVIANSMTSNSDISYSTQGNFSVGKSNDCTRYFDDVTSLHPLCNELSYLAGKGIITGKKTNNGTVADLSSLLTRVEFFTIADRLNGIVEPSDEWVDPSALLYFTDIHVDMLMEPARSMNLWWISPLLNQVSTGIVQGYADKTVRLYGNLTWAELAKVVGMNTGLLDFWNYSVANNPWYSDVLYVYERECAITYLKPNVLVTRGNAVRLIYDSMQCADGGLNTDASFY